MIVQNNLAIIKTQLFELRKWVRICSNEPIVIGRVFPTDRVNAVQVLLVQIAAAIETWLFGLQVLHRARCSPAHAIVHRILKAIVPLVYDIEGASRIMFQELIDCVDHPFEWAPLHSIQHLSDFV